MQAEVVGALAASGAAVAAAVSLGYARASAQAGREAVVAARRTIELAELSRQAAEQARLRQRVERVGELVQAIVISSRADRDGDGPSQWTRAELDLLDQAVIGLKHLLPECCALRRAASRDDLRARAATALAEVDRVLRGVAGPRSIYRHRRPARPAPPRRQADRRR